MKKNLGNAILAKPFKKTKIAAFSPKKRGIKFIIPRK